MPGVPLAAGGDEADQVVDFSVAFDGDDTEYEVRKARGRRIARHEGRAMVPRRSKQDRLLFFVRRITHKGAGCEISRPGVTLYIKTAGFPDVCSLAFTFRFFPFA